MPDLDRLLSVALDLTRSLGAEDRYGRLLDAVARNKPKDLRSAVYDGADVNLAAKDGWTPLMAAAKGGRPRLCELLLELGADRAARSEGRTAADVALTDELRALLAAA